MEHYFSVLEKYNNHKPVIFRIGDKLSEISKDIPNSQGVYVIYKNNVSFENIVYIGKAGTFKQDGLFGKQGLRERINNNQETGTKRQLFFENKMREQNISQFIITTYTTFDDINLHIPSYVEACLIQEYYEKTEKLPIWNKEY